MDDFLDQEQCDEQWGPDADDGCEWGPDVDEAMGIEIEHDGQPDDYTEWQDYMGGDDWDHDQYDNEYQTRTALKGGNPP